MKLLTETDVRSIVDADQAIRDSAEAFRRLSTGEARIPVRTEIMLDGRGLFFLMPGIVSEKYLGFKLIANRPDTALPGGLKTVSLILILDATTLEPMGMFSSDWFTDFRTAAGIAAAADKLASPKARQLVVFGAGKLGEPCVELVSRVRAFERIIVVGRNRGRLEAMRNRLAARAQPICVDIDTDPDAAVAAADVIVTVTSATSPVFDGRLVKPGTHISIGGAYRPDSRETDDAVAGQADFYVDSLPACLERAGDIRIPLESGVLSRDRIKGEIGALFAAPDDLPYDPEKVTVFKSLGNAAQDLLLGGRLLENACLADIRSFELKV